MWLLYQITPCRNTVAKFPYFFQSAIDAIKNHPYNIVTSMKKTKFNFVTMCFGAVDVIIIAFFVSRFVPTYQTVGHLKSRHADVLEQVESKKQEIEAIKENQKRFYKDREFVENLARQNKRMYPGELVFVFED